MFLSKSKLTKYFVILIIIANRVHDNIIIY
jgi:hypothetical protein